jgi:hypothetical protein
MYPVTLYGFIVKNSLLFFKGKDFCLAASCFSGFDRGLAKFL